MKKFSISFIKFCAFAFSTLLFLILASKGITSHYFDFKISEKKNVLVLGNSHVQNAINDHMVDNARNLSLHGSIFFYDHIKLKRIVQNNSHIDTLVLGYLPRDISYSMNLWGELGEDRNKSKIKNHFHLFDKNDYWNLLKSNPVMTLILTPQTILHNFKSIKLGLSGIGGYRKLKRFKLKEAIKKSENEPKRLVSNGLAKNQVSDLLKIYDFCNKKNIKLILLATPVRKEEVVLFEDYHTFYNNLAKNKLPKATFINHSTFPLPDSHYADLHHTNYLGAELYTEYLKEIGLFN